MKISLINVQISEGNNIVPPLGILYIAAALEQQGHELQVFDIDPDVSSCVEQIKVFAPHIVGLSCYTNTYPKAQRLTEKLKQELPHAIFICGGVHATAKPVETMRELRVDYLVYAEGERSTSRLVQCLESGALEEIAGIKGLYYWKNGEIVYTGPPELIDDLDSIPFPARRLLDFGPYLVPPGMIRGHALERITTLLTSRGCPYPCTYCASHIVQGKKVRRRSARNVIAELEGMVNDYSIRGFYICDDLVTGDRDWMMEFSRQLAQKNLGLRWGCQSRVDYVDEEMLSVMKQAGCVQIDFGVESGSDKTLKTMKKKATADEARAAFALMHRMKMRACATFILGFPGETEEDMEETYRLAKEINADYTAFYFLTPYPGTPIYNMAVQNAWIDPKLVADERFTHRQAAVPIMAIEHSPEKLAAIRRRFQNRFFVHNYLRWRNLRFYGSLLWALLGSPRDAIRAVGGFFRTLRLDDFVEAVFELHQRRARERLGR